MLRTPADLAAARYDLLIVGGGIHGLFAAYDAADRGLSVALVDQADFGSGLSFNHQRTIHGGLRALESGHVGKARAHMHERRTWARMAPHLIRPLPFLVGTYRFSRRSRWILRAGFAAYDLIGRSRNHGISPELHMPKAKLESTAATRRLFPGIVEDRLAGGAVWYDYQTRHPDRLNWTVALAARRAGATLANYVEAIAPLKDGSRIAGARVRDRITGREQDVQATVTLLAAGSGLGAVHAAFGTNGAPPLVRAMNLLLDRPARDIATAAPGRSGRMLTAVPWRGFVLVGTHQSPEPVTIQESAPPPAVIDEFLADVNAAFPRLAATRRDIRLVHHGLTPAVVRSGRAELLPEPLVIDHQRQGTAGLVSLVGVKFTTARVAAEHAVDRVGHLLGKPRTRCRTGDVALPFAEIADVEGRLVETLRELGTPLDREVIDHLTSWYGTEAADVVRFAAAEDQLARVSPEHPVLRGEIAYAARHAQAARLSDAVLRRTPLGSAGHPGADALSQAASLMAGALGWNDARRAEEIALVERVYPASTAP